MNVREFLTKWGFQIEHEKLDRVEKQLEGIKHRLEFLAAAEVVHALYELSEKFASVGEAIHIAAESAGLGVEAFQRLAFSAGLSNVSADEMQTSMARLSRSLYAARMGSAEAQLAFSQAGFSPEQVRGFHTSRDAMLALADRMRAIRDPIQKAALAQQLMGRGSIQMVGYLSQGSEAIRAQGAEADRLGAILSKGQVHALVEFEHAAKELIGALKGLAGTIAADVAPGFTYLIHDFLQFLEANRELVRVNFAEWLYGFGYALGSIWAAVKITITLLIDLAKHFHLEDKIVATVMSVIGAIVVLASLGLVMSRVIKLATAVGNGIKFLGTPFKVLWAILGFGQKVIAELLLQFAALIDSEAIFGAAAAVAGAPLWLLVAVIGAIVIAVHDLYKAFRGERGWLDQFFEWLGVSKLIEKVFFSIFATWDKFTGALGRGVDAAKKWLGIGTANAGEPGGAGGSSFLDQGMSPEDRIRQLSSPSAAVQTLAPQSSGPVSYDINMPTTINVPPGTSKEEVGKHVKDGVQEHFERVMRETRVSVLPAAVY